MFTKFSMNGNKLISRLFSMGKNNGSNGHNNDNYSDWLLDYDCNFYIENYFQDMLYMERKRAERSKKTFLLMLINISSLLNENGDSKHAKMIAQVLSSFKRETDIAGWYKYNTIMGVILTEIGGSDEDLIKEKIFKKFSGILRSDQVRKMKVTFHRFPEKGNKSKAIKQKMDLKLYPINSRLRYCRKTSIFLKRGIDIILSLIGIILFSPLFVSIPILIKLSSSGPVFFRQNRVGQYGKEFTFLKFRSMYINNDDSIHKDYVANLIQNNGHDESKNSNNKKGSYKITNDSRVTRIGYFLRKSSLDELPQFFNVLKGDMSLVGPRPPIPYEIEHYNIWHKRRIRRVKPGITGIWQVNGRSSTTFDEMVRMDIQYLRKWNLLMDIKILLKTPFVVINGKGAY